MKKLTVLATAVATTVSLLNGSIILAATPSTANQVKDESISPTHETSDYMKFSGVISEANQNGETLTFIIEDQEKSVTHLTPSEETLFFNSNTTEKMEAHTLKVGVHLDAYYHKNKPMLLIYPPRITPDLVIVHDDEMGQVKVSKFNEALVSEDHELKLNLSDDTVIVNQEGKSIQKEDLKGKELIVFYDVSTRSIPAQTTPKKVIALDPEEMIKKEIEELIQEDYYTKDGIRMIPIRKVAEHLGYTIEWKPETLDIILRQQNSSFQISIGEKRFAYNRSLGYFDVIPEIKNGKTYVPETFLDMLL